MAEGQATKIILPAELNGIASFGTVLDSMKDSKKNN